MMYEKLEKLLEFSSILSEDVHLSSEERDDMFIDDVYDAYDLFDAGVSEAMGYVSRLAREEDDICKVIIPKGDWYIGGDRDVLALKSWLGEKEIIYLPFGYFTANLWKKLKRDSDNPLFQLLRYFERCIKYIREIALRIEGVEQDTLLTSSMLEEY